MKTRVLDRTVTTVDVEQRRVDSDSADAEDKKQSTTGKRTAGIGHAAGFSAAAATTAGAHACAVKLLGQARKGLASGAVHVGWD
jgi:hypothetical protein